MNEQGQTPGTLQQEIEQDPALKLLLPYQDEIVGTADNVLRPILIGKDTEMPDLLVMLTTLGVLVLFGGRTPSSTKRAFESCFA